MVSIRPVQACMTTFPSRLRTGNTSLVTPNPGTLNAAGGVRSTTRTSSGRGATINYSELDGDDADGGTPNVPSYAAEIDEGGDARGFIEGPPPDNLIKRKQMSATRHISRTDEQLSEAATEEEVLIPIRLDIELDNYRLKDVFTWNMNEALITPDLFAQTMCADLDIPSAVYAPQISTAIRTQIEEYAPVAEIHLPPEHEMRVIVNLSLHFSKHMMTDQFEWNLTNTLTPEAFSALLCADLGLTGEFLPAVAHAIHEDLLKLKKEACEGGLPQEIDNEAAFGQEAGVRVDTETLGALWQPAIEVLSRDEIERRDMDRERVVRRLRRDASKFGGSGTDRSTERYRSRLEMSPEWGNTDAEAAAEPLPSATVADAQPLSESCVTLIFRAAANLLRERPRWRCQWCVVAGTGTWAVRRGPRGNKVSVTSLIDRRLMHQTLCNTCGVNYARTGVLPMWRKNLYAIQRS